MKRIEIRRGLDILPDSAALDTVTDATGRVALSGSDYPGVKPAMAVSEGDHVKLGEVLFTDRVYRELQFCAPASGVVSAIHRGARRSLQAVVVDLDDAADTFAVDLGAGEIIDAERIRRSLLAAGLWQALRTRPYDRVPAPVATSATLFITALDTNPLAPDPAPFVLRNSEAFAAGIDKLSRLSPRTFVCMGAVELPCPDLAGVTPVAFPGPHPAGLPGTHMHHLTPQAVSAWHVGYQDVIAIGRLFLSGRVSVERQISLAGPGAGGHSLVNTRLGAAIAGMLATTLASDDAVVCGSPLCGRTEALRSAFLGRYDNQVWVPRAAAASAPVAALQTLVSLLQTLLAPRQALARKPVSRDTGRQTGMLAVEAFDRVWPFRVPAAPLLRALLTRDTETASRLGALMLAEEDLALCTYVCPARQDYGAALLETLRDIERGD